MAIPNTEPLPPSRLTPPISAAVAAGSSSVSKAAGPALPDLIDVSAPVNAAIAPDRAKAATRGRTSGTPAAAASWRPPPTA